jgi:TLD
VPNVCSIVVGAYINCAMGSPSDKTRGDNSCFCFRIDGEKASKYISAALIEERRGVEGQEKAANNVVKKYVRCCRSYIVIGASKAREAANAIRLDRDLRMGRVSYSDTFLNPSLIPEGSSPFPVETIEIYVGPLLDRSNCESGSGGGGGGEDDDDDGDDGAGGDPNDNSIDEKSFSSDGGFEDELEHRSNQESESEEEEDEENRFATQYYGHLRGSTEDAPPNYQPKFEDDNFDFGIVYRDMNPPTNGAIHSGGTLAAATVPNSTEFEEGEEDWGLSLSFLGDKGKGETSARMAAAAQIMESSGDFDFVSANPLSPGSGKVRDKVLSPDSMAIKTAVSVPPIDTIEGDKDDTIDTVFFSTANA